MNPKFAIIISRLNSLQNELVEDIATLQENDEELFPEVLLNLSQNTLPDLSSAISHWSTCGGCFTDFIDRINRVLPFIQGFPRNPTRQQIDEALLPTLELVNGHYTMCLEILKYPVAHSVVEPTLGFCTLMVFAVGFLFLLIIVAKTILCLCTKRFAWIHQINNTSVS